MAYAKHINQLNGLFIDDNEKIKNKLYDYKGKKVFDNDDFLRKVHGKYYGDDDRRCYYEEILEYKNQKKLDEINEGIQREVYYLKEDKNNKGKHFIVERCDASNGKTKLLYSLITGF
ncbi:hypothetical protein FACS189459_1370 [Bacilli bacterium]|nr:hypothetical protein FACS189459_1370 [Bacilli bacterium]